MKYGVQILHRGHYWASKLELANLGGVLVCLQESYVRWSYAPYHPGPLSRLSLSLGGVGGRGGILGPGVPHGLGGPGGLGHLLGRPRPPQRPAHRRRRRPSSPPS
jgi:hypothetical protein